ncbi:hypothetical protein KPH14_012443 [Odynerus spinipes]|uniref:CHHC U11-48K-type domain-containing protein n=1 Tax=Odynerus spinipes TaxID=1348599 RepID=A0AAD9VMS3_9HYME|nr:hypothetical protein KPH14_012443 [Odynerus spinipes]
MKDEAEVLLSCPYEETHRIAKSVMAKHLLKCEKSHPTVKLERCPYNILHRIKPLEFQHHLATCENRANAASFLYRTEPPRAVESITVQEVNSIEGLPCTENWDAEPGPVESYDPTKHVMNNNIVYSIMCASKSEKRIFKQKERERHSAFANDTNTSSQKIQAPKLKDELEKPLRLPRHLPQALTQDKMKSDNKGTATENKAEETCKKDTSENSTNKQLNKERKLQSMYMDEDFITFTKAKNCTTTEDNSISKDDDMEAMLNSTAETCESTATNFLTALQGNSEKRFSAGRGISKIFEAYKNSGVSKEDFKSYFMNPKNDIDSLMKKNAETYNYRDAFFGYTEEESTFNMKDIEDELSSIGG